MRFYWKKFGCRCLLVLDGIDELDLKKNKEILNIIEGRRMLYCNVLVTSRPHSSAEIEPYFNTVVRVQGFNPHQADKYVSTVLNMTHKAVPVIKFYHANFQKSDSQFALPMLLLFICILVNADEIDLEQKNVTLGNIYTRLVRCLYRKFTVHKAIKFDHNGFVMALNRLGKLAWKTINSKMYHLQQSEILSDVGEDAFEYGLLIGYEDFNLLGHETADIFVTFLHSSIQEFLSGFYFILMLNAGETIESLLGSNCACPIFMMNPLVLYFCLSFLIDNIMFLQKEKLYAQLIQFLSQKINIIQFDLDNTLQLFPVLNGESLYRIEDELGFDILTDVLALCNSTAEFSLGAGADSGTGNFLSGPNLSRYCSMPNLQSILVVNRHMRVTGPFSDHEFSVMIDHDEYGSIDDLLEYCKFRSRNPSLYVIPQTATADISEFVKGNVQKVYICGDKSLNPRLTALSDKENCPFLTHLCLMQMIIDERVLVALSMAVARGQLPMLSHLSFERCGSVLKGKLPTLFESEWPKLAHLKLKGCYLDESDIQMLTLCLGYPEQGMLPNLTSFVLDFASNTNSHDLCSAVYHMFQFTLLNIKTLHLYNVTDMIYKTVVISLNQGKLPNLVKFGISKPQEVVTASEHLESFLINLRTPTDMRTHKFTNLPELLNLPTVSSQLDNLDISHSSGITGNLSMLLCHSFPSLNSLILSNCGLNSQDLCSLAQASIEGRLPQLRHLDISKNRELDGHFMCLFKSDCKWGGLLSLDIDQTGPVLGYSGLVHKLATGCFQSLQKLRMSAVTINNLMSDFTVPLKHLNRVELGVTSTQVTGKTLGNISEAVDKKLLPVLDTIVFNVSKIPATKEQSESIMKELVKSVYTKIMSMLRGIRNTPFNEGLKSYLIQNPSRGADLVADLRLTDRISSAFPDADQEMLESVKKEFSKKLAEILPDVLDRSTSIESLSQRMVILLAPLFAEKDAALLGYSCTEQWVSLWYLGLTRSHIDPQIESQTRASASLSDIKWKLRKQGIRIYYLRQSNYLTMFDSD